MLWILSTILSIIGRQRIIISSLHTLSRRLASPFSPQSRHIEADIQPINEIPVIFSIEENISAVSSPTLTVKALLFIYSNTVANIDAHTVVMHTETAILIKSANLFSNSRMLITSMSAAMQKKQYLRLSIS